MDNWTVKQLETVIETVTKEMKDPPGEKGEPRDYNKEARWLVSYYIAEEMCESYRAKDWAHYVQEGMEPLTEKDITEWLNPEGMGESGDEVQPMEREYVMTLVREFYGIGVAPRD